MRKSRSSISKELDIVKFIQRQRMTMIALLSLFSGRQKVLIDKMSQMLIRESSNFEETSSDDELSGKNDSHLAINSLVKSKD